MQFTRTQLIILGSVGGVILIVVLLFTGVIPGIRVTPPAKVELSYWGLERDEVAMRDVIARYNQTNRNVTINYRGIPARDYEEVLIDNLAAGTGPDIFLLRNDWFEKHKNKIFFAPPDLVSQSRVIDLFPSVVNEDFVEDNRVYGLPLSIDTLSLVYNRTIFDSKQIAVPPGTWDGIRGIIPDLREFTEGNLSRGAIALGDSNRSIANAEDIVTLLMMQSGSGFFDSNRNQVSFANANGLSAINLYTDFANPEIGAYSWDRSLGNSVDAFSRGGVSMGVFYHSQIQSIRERNPVLQFGVLPFPQLNRENPINYARYWSMVVSNRTSNYPQSWDFINFATTDVSAASAYLTASNSPPALRSLINNTRQNPELGVFVGQSLTARSWPVPDHARISGIINNMIESALTRRLTDGRVMDALRTAEAEINRLIQN